ncbi:hypothetical protein HDU93_008824 [Gonapodya sp. JEL0774]|nr:hypothetical protein HDU93_008824 [Gonapodya sp. JEL0774]
MGSIEADDVQLSMRILNTVDEGELRSEVEACTKELNNISLANQSRDTPDITAGSIFLRRAEALRRLDLLADAFADVRRALALDKSNAEAQESARKLLLDVSAKESAHSPKGLLLALSVTSENPGRRLDTAERLAAMCSEESAAKVVAREGGVEIVADTLISLISGGFGKAGAGKGDSATGSTSSIQTSTEASTPHLRSLLLRTLARLAEFPTHQGPLLSHLARGALPALLSVLPDSASAIAIQVGSASVSHFKGEESDPANAKPAQKAVGVALIQVLAKESTSVDLARAALAGLARCLSNPSAARELLVSEEYPALLAIAASSSVLVRDAAPSVLAKLYATAGIPSALSSEHDSPAPSSSAPRPQSSASQKTSEDILGLIAGATIRHITSWLDSPQPSTRTQSLLSVRAVVQASLPLGCRVILAEGFLDDVSELLEVETPEFRRVAVEVAGEVCRDPAGRKTIATKLGDAVLRMYLTDPEKAVSQQPTKKGKIAPTVASLLALRSSAALTLAKLAPDSPNLRDQLYRDPSRLLAALKTTLTDSLAIVRAQSDAVEALAYFSVRPEHKDLVAGDETLLKAVFSLCTNVESGPATFGAVSVIGNLAAYRPRLTAEEQQARKLKEFAKEVEPLEMHPAEDDDKVAKRCTRLVKLGAIAAVMAAARRKDASAALRAAAAEIVRDLVTDQKSAKESRGLAVQQGAVPVLLSLAKDEQRCTPNGRDGARQVLALLAVVVDPHLAFKSGRALEVASAVSFLLKGESELRQFEGLLALTNLTSMEGDEGHAVRERLTDLGIAKEAETLQFSEHPLVRRAATELLCNMVNHPAVFESFAGSSNKDRLKLLLALCTVDDTQLVRAASGCIAILSSDPRACALIAAQERGIQYVVELLEPDMGAELHHRGAEILKNLADCGKKEWCERIEKEGGVDALRGLVKQGTPKPVLETAVAALMAFRRAGLS